MLRHLFSLIFICLTLPSLAQVGQLTLQVTDSETKEGIAGAVIMYTPKTSPDNKQYLASGYEGRAQIQGLKYGTYLIEVSFLGYETLKEEVKIHSPRKDMGIVRLQQGVRIQTVVKEVKALRTSQRGDTVSYNAGAFKVATDADVEGLLKKMPGLTVMNGAVEAQGEEVKKIFVDGKEFFGDDVTTAIKSLPAEAVERIEVFNKLSDAAEFTGMDDGEGFKALNIITHPHMRQGQFGQLFAGVGYDAETTTEDKTKYTAGGNVNIFNKDTRLSIISLFNNVNQQNFSFEDILDVSGSQSGGHGRHGGAGEFMVRPQNGVAKVSAVGVNFTDTWGKKDQVSVDASYFFNANRITNNSRVDKWYEAPIYKNDTLQTQSYSLSKGRNHRFSGKLNWKISKRQNLMIRPRFSYQSYDPISWTQGWQYGAPDKGGSGYSRTDNFNDRLQKGYSIGTGIIYRVKLGAKGRSMTLDGYGRYSSNDNLTDSYSNRLGRNPFRPEVDPETGEWNTGDYIDPETGEERPRVELRYQHFTAPVSRYNLRGQVTYSEPLAKKWLLNFRYSYSFDEEERTKDAYLTGADFSIEGLTPDPMLSNSSKSNYSRWSLGPGIRYSEERNSFVVAVNYQNSTLENEGINQRMTGDLSLNKTYHHVTYFMMTRWNINPQNSIRMFVSSYTWKPSINQLQDIYDVSNFQHIKHGNPDLNPAYRHTIRFHYTNSNTEKGRTFMWMLYFQAMMNYNATHMIQNPGEITINERTYRPNYYSTTVNLDGYRMLRTQLSYGLPIGFLKSNFNLSVGLHYTRTPSMMGGRILESGLIEGGTRNDTYDVGYDFQTVLGSNISEKVDFTLSWEGHFDKSTNNFEDEKIKNRYFNHSAVASMKFVFPLDFTFTGSYAYTQYLGFTNNYDDSYMLCNLWIGKKIFRNRRGEIMVGVNDVFNQNKAFIRTTGSGWTQNALHSVVGRYYMVKFNFNLRHFGKNGSQDMEDYNVRKGHPHDKRKQGGYHRMF